MGMVKHICSRLDVFLLDSNDASTNCRVLHHRKEKNEKKDEKQQDECPHALYIPTYLVE